MKEIATVIGETDGVNTSGDCSLYADIIYSDATYQLPTSVLIPYGVKAKIWAKRIAGEGETTFGILYSKDITSAVWKSVDVQVLPAKGEITLEKRRPIVLRSITGKEGFKISWSQPSAAKAYIELEVEFSDEQ